MKRKKGLSFFVYLGSLFLLLFFILGCNNNPIEIDDPIDNPTIFATISKTALEIDETAIIDAEILNTKKTYTITYQSDNESVATVSGGLITAIAPGEALITVSIFEFPEVKYEQTITVLSFPLTLTGDNEVFIGETISLTGTDNRHPNDGVFWESLDLSIATVNQNGVVTGIGEGIVTIKITSLHTEHSLEKEIIVITPDAQNIEISTKQTEFKSYSEIRLEHKVFPLGANQDVEWSSSNTQIATVDQNGKVTTLKSGTVDITATTTNNVKGKITLNITVDPIALISSLNVDRPIVQYVTTYGNTERQQWVYGSVSKFFPQDMNFKNQIIPITPTVDGLPNIFAGQFATQDLLNMAEFKTVRSGIIKPKISSIIYHDTGNNNPGANATMHANYIVGDANFKDYKARSWHYTVDDTMVIQHLPDNEVGWQGDTYLAYSTTIGIESCVDFGNDLYTTWHRTGKLIAELMKKYNLKITDVKQHYDFSLKNCPQTLRRNNLYQNAIDLAKAEYLVLTELEGYNISFISNALEYVNNLGRVINLPDVDTRISYVVTITNDSGYNQSVTLYSTIPGKTV